MAKEAKFPLLPRLTLRALRFASGWSESALAAAVGTSADFIGQMELGNRKITPENFLRFSRVMGFEPEQVEMAMQGLRWLVEPREMAAGHLENGFVQSELHYTEEAAQALRGELATLATKFRLERARQRAEGICRLLVSASAARRRLILASTQAWDSWAIIECLCEASVLAAPQDARKALARSALALRVAEASRSSDASAKRLQGYAWAFVGNARRVSNDLSGASKAFATAWRLWRAGEQSMDCPLTEWRLLCLEASLRRDSRHFPEALDLLDRALESAPPDARGRILVNRAFVLNQCGEPAEALRTLSRAEPLIDEPIEPRLRYVLRFNQAVSLIELGRAEEAASLIPDLQRRAETLGNKLDLLRTLWVSSRVDAALGREEYALASLERVVREFSDLNLGWDAALASLELVALRLKRGEHQAAQVLAEAMAWIFAEKGVGSDCVAAVALFREAARREEASVAMARNAWLVVKQALSLPLPLEGV